MFPCQCCKIFTSSFFEKDHQRLLLPLEVFCKIFANISYENASLRMLEDSIWLTFIYWLTTITSWFVKYLLWIDGCYQIEWISLLFHLIYQLHDFMKNIFPVMFYDFSFWGLNNQIPYAFLLTLHVKSKFL